MFLRFVMVDAIVQDRFQKCAFQDIAQIVPIISSLKSAEDFGANNVLHETAQGHDDVMPVTQLQA